MIDPQKVLGEWVHAALLVGTALFCWLFLNGFFWFIVSSCITVRVLKCLFIITKSVVVHKVMPELDLTPLKSSWTVVTGGTDGIGKAYITEMARARGIRKFYLIGRNSEKLNKVAGELRKGFDAEVRTALFDFNSDDLTALPEELHSMDIGILLNFVGVASPKVGNLVEQDVGMASQIMRVNTMSCIKMNEIVLPGMIKRNRGIIVNMSSMTGWRPLPYVSAYPASKAAISFFSDALSDEFRKTNVKVQCLVPMLVATGLASYDSSEANDVFVVSAESFARQAVHAIGTFELITGCFQHDIQIAFGTLLSFWLFKQIFIPFGMLGQHQKRVEEFQRRKK